MWRSAKTVDDIIEFNIKAINENSESAFNLGLTDDVMPHKEQIIKINRAGFMTLDSQLAAKFDVPEEEPSECGFIVKKDIKTEDSVCYQRGYCEGFLKKSLLFSLSTIVDKGYDVKYYDYDYGYMQKSTESVNLTYYDYPTCVHYYTNFKDVVMFAEIDLQHLHQAITYNLLKKFVNDMCYFVVLDNDYNTGKNIYQDILEYIL
jgi:hypothetical protein